MCYTNISNKNIVLLLTNQNDNCIKKNMEITGVHHLHNSTSNYVLNTITARDRMQIENSGDKM